MENKQQTTLIALLVVGLVIGGGIGYFAAPKGGDGETIVEVPVIEEIEVHPLAGKTITIASHYSSDPNFEVYDPMNELAAIDIQEYLDMIGLDITYKWMSDSCAGDLAIAMEKVQSFHAMGNDIMTGYSWSGMTSSVLSYVNDNNMLIYSCYSTSPLLSIKDDNLFRLVPNDFQQGPIDAKMVWEYGIDAVATLHAADAYGDGISNVFDKTYVEDWGGVLLEGAQCRVPVGETEMSTYLDAMNTAIEKAIPIYGKNHVGVYIISRSLELMSMVQDYPTLMEVPWFGTDATGRTYQLYTDAPEGASKCRIMSTMPTPAYSSKMWDVAERYTEACGIAWHFARLSMYDTDIILVKGALEVGAWDALAIRDILIELSGSHFGTVGWCFLDDTGDMPAMVYDIWGYTQSKDDPTMCMNVKYGSWSAVGNVIAWNIDPDAPRVEISRGDDPIYDTDWVHGSTDISWVD